MPQQRTVTVIDSHLGKKLVEMSLLGPTSLLILAAAMGVLKHPVSDACASHSLDSCSLQRMAQICYCRSTPQLGLVDCVTGVVVAALAALAAFDQLQPASIQSQLIEEIAVQVQESGVRVSRSTARTGVK